MGRGRGSETTGLWRPAQGAWVSQYRVVTGIHRQDPGKRVRSGCERLQTGSQNSSAKQGSVGGGRGSRGGGDPVSLIRGVLEDPGSPAHNRGEASRHDGATAVKLGADVVGDAIQNSSVGQQVLGLWLASMPT